MRGSSKGIEHAPSAPMLRFAALTVYIICALAGARTFAAESPVYQILVLDDRPHHSSTEIDEPPRRVVSLNGTKCETIAELKEAILRLPAGSRVELEVGCFGAPRTMPIGPPPHIPTREFREWCLQHGIRFSITHNTAI
jgi:hypothetical protein